MARITKADLAATIEKLRKSGRSMPQSELMRGAANPVEMAMKILQDTVDLWWDAFGAQNISQERWQAAEKMALTMPGVPGIPVNTITTNLMAEALRRAEQQYVEEYRAKCEQEKHEDFAPMDWGAAKALWHWTGQMMRAGLPLPSATFPKEEDVTRFALENGINRTDAGQMRSLIRMVLTTNKVCASCPGIGCPFEHKRPVIDKASGKLAFHYRPCRSASLTGTN